MAGRNNEGKRLFAKKINHWVKKSLKAENPERERFYENLPAEFCRSGDSREPSASDYNDWADGKYGVAGVVVEHYYECPDGHWDDGSVKYTERTYSRFFSFAEETKKLRELQDAFYEGNKD